MRPSVTALILLCIALAPLSARSEAPYEVSVTRAGESQEGLLSDDPLLEKIRNASELVSLVDRVPQTPGILRNRIESDSERLIRVLRAEGYYDGTVEIRAEDLPRAQSAAPEDETAVRVHILVVPGPQYTLRTYAIDNAHPHGAPFPVPIDLDDLGIALGDPATGRRIVRAQDTLIDELGNRGRPFAQMVDRMVIADHEAMAVDVTLTVDAGPEVYFGPLEIAGLEEVEAELIRDRIAWTPGALYDQNKVDETRVALAQREVFNSVSIRPAEDWAADGDSVPMQVNVTERDHRTIGGGLRYSTADGPGGRLYWRHRNLFGQAERLRLELSATHGVAGTSTIERQVSLGADYRDNSMFEDVRYTFTAESELSHEETTAYTSRSFENAVGVSYDYDENLLLSAGARIALTSEERDEDTSRFVLFGLPTAVEYDLRDSSFNPTRGSLSRLTVEPLLIVPDPSLVGVRTMFYQSGYWAPFDDDSVVLAGWGRIGGLIGADRDSLPVSERFFVGGGGSVRGFAFRMAGELDENNEPVGGQSMVAVGAETRFRFLDDYGAALFLEGGRAYADAIPSFGEPMLWGAGVGARYYTDFGPIRLDVATPLNGRSGVDESIQFYISFGQAF